MSITQTYTIIWLAKSLLLLIDLSIACEKFYANVRAAESFSYTMFDIDDSGMKFNTNYIHSIFIMYTGYYIDSYP